MSSVFAFAVVLMSASSGMSGPYARPRANPVIALSLQTRMVDRTDARHRVWVFFTDKRVADAVDLSRRIADRARQFPARTIERRLRRGLNAQPIGYEDLPPDAEYVHAVRATGATLRHSICALNAVSVEADAAQLRAVAALPFVRRIQSVAQARRQPLPPHDPIAEEDNPRSNDAAFYGASFSQLSQIGIVPANKAGYTGGGIVIGVLDTGFNRTHNAFNQNTGGAHPVQVIDEYDFLNDDPDTTQQPEDADGQAYHGTFILGTIGAYHPGSLVGGAYDASFLLAKTEDLVNEVPAEEDHYVAGLQWVELNGADMATSSLGYIEWYTPSDLDGQTAVTTLAVNIATANGLVCCTAAGNEGHDSNPATNHLLAPSDAFAVLACGAVDSMGVIAGFSSDGPSADGRVKPEVLARGVSTATVSFSNNTDIVGVSGTSLSTPLLAAGTALIIQAHPDWNVDKIRRALFHTAGDFVSNATVDPLHVRGYGIINVYAAIQFVHGDINGDGFADGRDIRPFVSAVLGTNGDTDQVRRADCDASGVANLDDLPIFVVDLLGLP